MIGFLNCITANINQPPSIIEKTTPYYFSREEKNKEENLEYSKREMPTKEEEFFDELSKQDPYLNPISCKKCPENQPPGYIENSKPEVNQTNQIEQATIPSNPDNAVVIIDSNYNNTNNSNNFLNENDLIGIASWYGKDFDGRPTASGELFDSRKLTGAHRTIPLGSIVSVRNLENGKEVILKINDRGPYVKNRIIDVSEYAAELLSFKNKGLTKVELKILSKGDLKEKGEGTTAFFYKEAQLDMGSSPYEKAIEVKKQEIMPKILSIEAFKNYSVQIANFTDIRNVIRLKEEIEKKFPYPVYIIKRDQEYLVRIGSFSERYSAEVLKQKLEQSGYTGFITSP